MFSFSALSPLDKRISSWTNSRESKLGLPSPVPLEQHCRHFRTAVRINKEMRRHESTSNVVIADG